jgi:hypothetical protein
MFAGGKKSKFVSLLSLIKVERPALYEAIGDLCLDGTFRSQRHTNTFLMPSKALVKDIVELIDTDKDIDAINAIRSLLLKNHIKKEDFKDDSTIETLQFGVYKLAKPSDVAKHISPSKMTIITTKEGSDATIVYDYDGKDVPATVATGKASGGMIPVGSMRGGWVDNNHAKVV